MDAPTPSPPPDPSAGAWTGTLVALYATVALTVEALRIGTVSLVRPALEAVGVLLSREAERRDLPDVGGDIARATLDGWAVFEVPLLVDGALGMMILFALLVGSLALVAGSELARRAVRLGLFVHAAVIVGWGLYVSLVIVGKIRPWLEQFERAWVELQRATGEGVSAQGFSENASRYVSGGFTWAVIALHLVVVLLLYAGAGGRRTRAWCAARGVRRAT